MGEAEREKLELEEKRKKRSRDTADLRTFTPEDNIDYIFISYSSKNWETVLNGVVRNMINRYGLRVYFDKNFARDNDLWEYNMMEAIETSKCIAFLAFIGKDYMKSYPCLMEALKARAASTEFSHGNKPLPIVPIIVDDSSDIEEAKSKSSSRVQIKEWNAYTELIEDALDSEEAKDKPKLKQAIKILSSKKDRITEENLSNTLGVLVDGKYRKYDKTDIFYDDLYKTIKSFGGDVFDESVTDIYSKKGAEDSRALKSEAVKEDRISDIIPETRTPIREISTAEVSSAAAETSQVPAGAAQVTALTTLEEFEKLLLNAENCMHIRKARDNKALFPKQMFDYVMAAILRGCDQKIENHSARWYYCKYAVAKDVDTDSTSIGASQFTWSSNSRKAVGMASSGKLGKNSEYFEKLPKTLSLGQLRTSFKEKQSEAFQTKNNQAVDNVFEVLFHMGL